MDSESVTAEAELAEQIVLQVAPEERELFGVISEVYRHDPERFIAGGPARDEMLGFGVETAAALFTPIVLAAVGEVARYLTESGLRGWLQRRRHGSTGDDLSPGQIARVRQIVLEKCQQAGVADGKSELLADGIVGALGSGA